MLRFETSSFAIAGIIASAVPVVIHLLNRRRFKTVNWGAMDFLREALERQRKTLRVRDVLLLASRMLSILLIGLMLSKPYIRGAEAGAIWQLVMFGSCLFLTLGFAIAWATSEKMKARGLAVCASIGMLCAGFQLPGIVRHSADETDGSSNSRTPIHAVLVIDNSRSLGVESLGGTIFDRAKAKAIEFIDVLPLESRITIIPLAGSEDPVALDAYRNKDEARRVVDLMKVVDVAGSIRSGLEQAEFACRQVTDPSTKRIVLFTDAQANAWDGITPDIFRRLFGLQIVKMAHEPARNVWVSAFHVEDGLANSEVPCRFLARVHADAANHSSVKSSHDEMFDVQAKLIIDNVQVSSHTISMTAGQEREVEFTHQFELRADPMTPRSANATLAVQSEQPPMDQLLRDNSQQVMVPIVSSLPVVFVDQYGDEENLEQNKIGETYALRHLMSPRSNTEISQTRLIRVEHIRPEQLTLSLLQSARLVVVAGIEKPDEAFVSLLRDFVKQGGPLAILAGGQFNSTAWTERAWLAGRGILPVPLDDNPLGQAPEEASQHLRPFFAKFSSMQHVFFLIEGESHESLSSLFGSTPFFKAIRANIDATILDELMKSDAQQFSGEKTVVEEYSRKFAARHYNEAALKNSDDVEVERKYREIEPVWWRWRSPFPLVDRSMSVDELAKRSQPRVLASFEGNNLPYVIERSIGAGSVVFFTSGVTSNWNTLRSSGAMYLFHRTFCQLIERTLPQHTFEAGAKITMPIGHRHGIRYFVTRPSGITEPLPIDSIGPSISSATIRRPLVAGMYTVSTEQIVGSSSEMALNSSDKLSFAVNGVESESDLTSISDVDLKTRIGNDDVRLLTADEPIPHEEGIRRHQSMWKISGGFLLGCLLLEKMILAWPLLKTSLRSKIR